MRRKRIGSWMRQAVFQTGYPPSESGAIFGDNMREVAVTDGDKVCRADQVRFFSVNTWAVGDLVQVVNEIGDGDVSALV